MKHEDQLLEEHERAALLGTVAPADLWERIEVQAKARPSERRGQVREQVGILQEGHRFAHAIRFAAAGLLGFVSFFAMQMVLVPDAAANRKISLTAGGPLVGQQIVDGIPLMGDSAAYVDSMQDHLPWPEIVLATHFVTTESN
jgi:hypothetical protein